MSRRYFRAFLVLNVLLSIGVMVVRVATEDFLPSEGRELWSTLYPRIPNTTIAYILLYDGGAVILGAVASAGLFFFKRWARYAFLGYVLVKMFFIPLSSPYIDSGQTVLTFYLCSLVEGFIGALLFYSPFKEVFVPQGDAQQRPASDRE